MFDKTAFKFITGFMGILFLSFVVFIVIGLYHEYQCSGCSLDANTNSSY